MSFLQIPLIIWRNQEKYTAYLAIVSADFAVLQAQETQILHELERTVYAQYKTDKRKHSFLLGRYSAKLALKEPLAMETLAKIHIENGVFQHPVVKNNATDFRVSISHGDKLGASLAYPEQHPMAIDVEQIQAESSIAIQDNLTKNELNLIEKSNSTLDFIFRLWSAKEALSKIMKTGLTIPLEFYEIAELSNENEIYICKFKHFIQYKVYSLKVKNYIFSIAMPARSNLMLDTQFIEHLYRVIGKVPSQKADKWIMLS